MGYRELHRMEIEEVVRRWQAGEGQRAIARATGLARATVAKYLTAAAGLGLGVAGPPPSSTDLVALHRLGVVTQAPRTRVAPRIAVLTLHQEQIATWLRQDRLQLTRVRELLGAQGVAVPYTTLRRFVRQAGLGTRPRSTVRLPETAPGDVAEMDFEQLGPLLDPLTGKRPVVWGLSVVLVHSRHSFLWPLVQQTVEATIEGLEAAWRFFGGIPHRLILDNFPAAIAGPDALHPKPTRAFLEYSQARGFLLDPARVRHPKDKPHVERGVQYARERFWKGGAFRDLADARQQAARWCREVAGQRVHGTTRQVPLVVFADAERQQLLPYDGVPYDVPRWRTVTVHVDHHVSVRYALYSAPSTTCPPGTRLEARADRDLVRLYRRGELVKTHPRQPAGGRSTDPADYPAERATYAQRAAAPLLAQAQALGPRIGQFADRLLADAQTWQTLRQAQKLLRLADRYTPARLEAACARALGFDLLNVTRLERILVLALDHEGLPAPPAAARVLPLPTSRYARPGAAFDHRFTAPAVETPV